MSLGEATVTIKKVKKVMAAGHHGGAWKVAYADFVTAMMAFFLLMWLINTVSPEQKKGLADYFAPASVSATNSGSGGILAGTALGDDDVKGSGAMSVIEKLAPPSPNPSDTGSSEKASLSDDQLNKALHDKQQADFQSAMQSIKQAMQKMPDVAELSKNVRMDITDDGLLIQLVDQEGRSMFQNQSAELTPTAQLLLQSVAKTINGLPNTIRISGHTSIGSSGRTMDTDWPLSFNRANAARQVLVRSGVNEDRIHGAEATANAEPLYPDDPALPGNRRISILLLRAKPVLPADHAG